MAQAIWYLGLDLGTTGLSAVLFDSESGTTLPISWLSSAPEAKTDLSRLPAVAYCGPGIGTGSSPFVVGTAAKAFARKSAGVYLHHSKSLLNTTLPYYLADQHQWQPQVQLPDSKAVSLYLLQRLLEALLTTLTSEQVTAQGKSPEETQVIMKQLQGVMISCPESWGDAYRFNVREAVLSAQLVNHPQQVYFVPEAVAAWLGTLPSQLETTLVIHAGASTTELALCDLPRDLADLTVTHFHLRSLAYGGKALAEDTFWQLLRPQWQDSYPFLRISLDDLPQPGHPDRETRYFALQHLQDNAFEQSARQAAELVQRILQQREVFRAKLGNCLWEVQRSDWNSRVVQPYLNQLNGQLNHLLSQSGISPQAITQVMLSGGAIFPVLPMVREWLQQKLINVEFRAFTSEQSLGLVAQGLAHLPRYPQVLDRARHQYSDYFLLSELLSLQADVYTTDEIFQQLQRRGINPKACERRILQILQGELPAGFIPQETFWFTPESRTCLIYQELQASPLFETQGRGYRLNQQQQERCQQYLSLVLQGTEQTLAEPLGIELG